MTFKKGSHIIALGENVGFRAKSNTFCIKPEGMDEISCKISDEEYKLLSKILDRMTIR